MLTQWKITLGLGQVDSWYNSLWPENQPTYLKDLLKLISLHQMQRNEARLKFFALQKTFVTFFTIRFKDPNLGSEQVGASLQHPILFIHPLEGHFKGVHTIGFSKY